MFLPWPHFPVISCSPFNWARGLGKCCKLFYAFLFILNTKKIASGCNNLRNTVLMTDGILRAKIYCMPVSGMHPLIPPLDPPLCMLGSCSKIGHVVVVVAWPIIGILRCRYPLWIRLRRLSRGVVCQGSKDSDPPAWPRPTLSLRFSVIRWENFTAVVMLWFVASVVISSTCNRSSQRPTVLAGQLFRI